MEKGSFEKLDDALKEKLMNCKDEAEMRKAAAESGMELNDDQLEAVSGGDGWNTCGPKRCGRH